MEAILEPLLRSPQLPRYLDELNELRAREAEARQRFRESLDEDVRAEFINGEVVIQMTARDEHTTTIRNLGRLLDIFVQIRQLGAVRTEQALTDFVRNDYLLLELRQSRAIEQRHNQLPRSRFHM